MVKTRKHKSTLELGELSRDFLMNQSEEGVLERACQTALNVILKAGGGAKRRPGGDFKFSTDVQPRRFRFRGRGFVEELVFTNGVLFVHDEDGVLLQTIGSQAWVTADLDNLRFGANANKVFVTSALNTLPVQELTRAADGTWSVAAYQFSVGVNGKRSQPFYDKFDEIDTVMTVGAYSGTGVTLQFNQDVLVAGHVGLRFRYMAANEMVITAVTDAQNATVDIVDTLYPTLDLPVASSANYKVGEVVEGDVSNVRGVIVEVPTGTSVRVILLEGYERFQYSATAEDNDKLITREAGEALTAAPVLVTTPFFTSIYDEQLISAVRGYPGSLAVHKNRLILSAFAEATDVVCGSANGNFYDFAVGAEDENAFNEELGADPNSEIRHVASKDQLVIMTDRGCHFVPESPQSPLTPANIAFYEITPDGCSLVEPFSTPEGIVFIDNDAGRLMVLAQAGSLSQPSWDVAELSEAAYHMLTGPKRLVVANGLDGRTERYAMVLNDDGTVACMIYRRGSDKVGFSRWTHGEGAFSDITVSEDRVFMTSKIDRVFSDIETSSIWLTSEMKFSSLVDDEAPYVSAASDTTIRNTLSDVVKDGAVIGSGDVVLEGGNWVVEDLSAAAGQSRGFDFDVDVTPAPQTSMTGSGRVRIPKTWVDVLDTGIIQIGNSEYLPWGPDDPLDDPGKTRTQRIVATQLGWSYEATKFIGQTRGRGGAFDVRSILLEVSK